MKGTSHKILSVLLALVLVVSMLAAVVAPASGAVAAVLFVPNPTTAGAAATWTVTFTTTVAMIAGDTITVVFPAGVVVPTTISKTSILVGTAAAPVVATVDASVTGNSVIVTAAGAIGAGASTVIFSQVAGIKNPTRTTGTVFKGSVETSKEAGAVLEAAGWLPTRLVTFAPPAGPVGTAVTVTGVGFAVNSSLDLTGGAVGAGTTDATGAFSIVGSAAAAAVVTATDGAGTPATASVAAFVLTARAVAAPTSGIVSTVVTVTGSGFPGAAPIGAPTVAGVALVVEAVQANLGPGEYFCVRDSNAAPVGNPIVQIMLAANASAGAKTIAVTEGASTATATFTVDSRAITLSPATGPAGTTVTITGTGFSAYAPAAGSAITFNAAALVPPAGFATTGTGTMSASIVVPVGTAAGTYQIRCTDSRGNIGNANFVIPAAAPAAISISPLTGNVGSTITITGSGFRALSNVTIQFTTPAPAQQTIVGTGSTDSAGSCTVNITVPVSAAGFATVTVTDAVGGTANTTYTVTAAPVVVTVANALSSVSANVPTVWTFNAATQAWQLWDKNAPAVSDLANMTVGQGYWMQSAADCILTFGVRTYALKAGWNLIGWLG